MYLYGLVLARKETWVNIEAFVGRRRKSGWLLLCCKIEGLVVEYDCDTPHFFQIAVVAL